MPSRILVVAGVTVAALVAPAVAAAAPVIAPLKPCYVTANTAAGPRSEAVAISATGFTPNSKVSLSVDGAAVASGLQTDPNGALQLPPNSVAAPFVREGSKTFEVTLTEDGNPANTATVQAKSTALGVTVKPRRARPSSRVRFKGSGFTGNAPVYAHYLYKGKVRKTVRMARKPGGCGKWSAKRSQIPVSNPGTGLWTVQFDQSKKFVKPTKIKTVFVRMSISVTLTRG